MTLTLKAQQTARRNLVQRIDRVMSELKSGIVDPWVSLYLVRAIGHLKTQAFSAGEDEASRAENPAIWKKVGDPQKVLSVGELKALLLEAQEASA